MKFESNRKSMRKKFGNCYFAQVDFEASSQIQLMYIYIKYFFAIYLHDQLCQEMVTWLLQCVIYSKKTKRRIQLLLSRFVWLFFVTLVPIKFQFRLSYFKCTSHTLFLTLALHILIFAGVLTTCDRIVLPCCGCCCFRFYSTSTWVPFKKIFFCLLFICNCNWKRLFYTWLFGLPQGLLIFYFKNKTKEIKIAN